MLGAARKRIAVAMSGGVDSSVCAWLLAAQGHEVVAMYMRNWDARDETGECQADRDWRDVRRVHRQLPTPQGPHPEPVEWNFSKDYWNEVFVPFLETYSAGLTPNPDVACNRFVKFGVFLERALQLGVDYVATGHYARRIDGPAGSGGPPLLVCAADPRKDQTYFLSQVPGAALGRVLFPLGGMTKSEVRIVAERAGVATAHKRESMGICFVGKKRRFADFLGQYVELTPGKFVSLDGKVLGQHQGAEAFTIGQGARIPGIRATGTRFFVAGKCGGDLIVCPGTDHPALFRPALTVRAHDFHWVAGRSPVAPPGAPVADPRPRTLRCHYRAWHGQALAECTVSLQGDPSDEGSWVVHVDVDVDVRAAAPGQILALYAPLPDGVGPLDMPDDTLPLACLGGGPILPDHVG